MYNSNEISIAQIAFVYMKDDILLTYMLYHQIYFEVGCKLFLVILMINPLIQVQKIYLSMGLHPDTVVSCIH